MEGRFHAFHDGTFSQPLDRRAADLYGFSDLGIRPLLLLRTTIRFQENAGTGDSTSRGLPLLDCGAEQEALGIREGDNVEFCHGVVLLGKDGPAYSDILIKRPPGQ
jgi:hypothetical protein